MDQQISIRRIFNHCFTHLKTKSKDPSESKHSSSNNRNEPECVQKILSTEKSSFHKLMSKSKADSLFNKDYKMNGIKQSKDKRLLFSCFKRNSLKDEMSVTAKKEHDLKTVHNSFYKGDYYLIKEAISHPKPSTSEAHEPKSSKHHSHDSVIELMSKDGTLRLYSASTLTPLSSVVIHDEDRIQTHMSISCLHPETHLQGSFSDGPDDVFESSDEASNRLAYNFQRLGIEHRKCVPDSSSGIQEDRKHRMNDSQSGHPVREDSYSLFSNGYEETTQVLTRKNKHNKSRPFITNCLCSETQNYVCSSCNIKRHSCNRPQTFNSEEFNQEPSNVPFTKLSYQNQDNFTHSVHSSDSTTNLIPSVKKWILQLYFNSMVANDETFYGNKNQNYYSEENYHRDPYFSYALQNDSITFNQAALEEHYSPNAFASDSSEINYNADFHTYQSNTPPVKIRKNSPTTENKNSEKRRKLESRNYKVMTDSKSKKNMQKENLSRTKSSPTAETSRKRVRRPFREKFWNSKPPVFSQDTKYTYYSFIDGPLAENFENNPVW